MNMIDLNNKTLKIIRNDGVDAQLPPGSLFVFKQEGNKVSADYKGGKVVKGHLDGEIKGDKLYHHYEQYNEAGEKFTGNAEVKVIIKEDGKIQLLDEWEWESQEGKGSCLMEEI